MTHLPINAPLAAEIAELLLNIQAVKLDLENPFTWSSGWRSPIYCDNRLTLGYPDIRDRIKESLATRIQEEFTSVEAIAGVATAGIPHATLVADHLNLPFLYVRSKPKGHGLENLIEGRLVKSQKVVVIEDLISTAGSSLRAIKALRDAGCEVLGLAAIFNYGFPLAQDQLAQKQVMWFSLSDYNSLIDFAAQRGIVEPVQVESLQAWRREPQNWKQANTTP